MKIARSAPASFHPRARSLIALSFAAAWTLGCVGPATRGASPASAWGRFRGPNGAGCGSGPLPERLDPEGNLAWRTAVPPGYSSPVVTATQVVVTCAEGTELSTVCLSRASGEVEWRRAAPVALEERHRGPNSPVSPTPATDGESVYVFFEAFGLVSYDARGAERWRLPLGPFNTPYGMGTSPVVCDGSLYLLCDQDTDSYLLAVDADDGSVRWKAPRPEFTHGFSSPVVYRPEDGPAEVIVSGSYQVAGYSAETGEKLWWARGLAWQAKSLPVIAGDTVFVHSWMASPSEFGVKNLTEPWSEAAATYDADADGRLSKGEAADLGLAAVWFLYDLDGDEHLDEHEWGYSLARAAAQNGLFAYRLGERGDVSESALLWRYKRSLPNIPSPLVYDGVLYVLKEGGILTALDPASGDVLKAGRVEGATDDYFASPVAADGKLLTASHPGRVAVLRAGPQWEVLSVRDFGEDIWATPAIADGQVFVRTQEALYCFRG